MLINCINCYSAYPEKGTPYRCSDCTGVYDLTTDIPYDPKIVETELPGIWRYRHTFGLSPESKILYLGEGDTPLIRMKVSGKSVAFKLEYLNPTGSFKDRGTAVMTSFLKTRSVESIVEDSSGNAGASLAAYAAHAGIEARIFIPESASGPKREQIRRYGAEIVSVGGPRSNCASAVQREADRGRTYASHVYLPHGLVGFSTIAYEIIDQLGQVPGAVIMPVGHGSLLLGIYRGFFALQRVGEIPEIPILIGVQARVCAPLWARYTLEQDGNHDVVEGSTLAEGVRIIDPLRGKAVLAAVKASQGWFETVQEKEIMVARNDLASMGFYVEPTSAIAWPALCGVLDKVSEPVVVILTGSGYKYLDYSGGSG